MRIVLAKLIEVYQNYISPFLLGQCRFAPTCSHYAKDAIMKHGAIHGSWLTLNRLSKCHPWHEGGVDFVPDKSKVERKNVR